MSTVLIRFSSVRCLLRPLAVHFKHSRRTPMRSRLLLLFILLALLCPQASLFAQTTSGSIAGTVTDPQQAAIAGATVTVTDETKGFSQKATTDAEGRFVFPQLPPATYI